MRRRVYARPFQGARVQDDLQTQEHRCDVVYTDADSAVLSLEIRSLHLTPQTHSISAIILNLTHSTTSPNAER